MVNIGNPISGGGSSDGGGESDSGGSGGSDVDDDPEPEPDPEPDPSPPPDNSDGGAATPDETTEDAADEYDGGQPDQNTDGGVATPDETTEEAAENVEVVSTEPAPDSADGGEAAAREREIGADDDTSRLDEAAETYTETISEPIGDFTAAASPVVFAEQAAFGTNRTERLSAGFGEGVAEIGNVPGIAAGTIDVAQAGATGFDRGFEPLVINGVPTGVYLPDQEGQQQNVDDAINVGAAQADAAASSPFETAGMVAGGAVGGAAVSRGARAAGRAVPDSRFDVDDFVRDERAQTGGRRTDSDTIEQETIEVEETIGDTETAGSDSIEDIPGVSVQNTRRQADDAAEATGDLDNAELEDAFRELAGETDEVDDATTTQTGDLSDGELVDAFEELAGESDDVATGTATTTTAAAVGGGAAAGATSADAVVTADAATDVAVGPVELVETGTQTQTTTTTGTTQRADTTADTATQTSTTTDTTSDLDQQLRNVEATRTTTRTARQQTDRNARPRPDEIDVVGGEDDDESFDVEFGEETFTNPTASLTDVSDDLSDIGGLDDP